MKKKKKFKLTDKLSCGCVLLGFLFAITISPMYQRLTVETITVMIKDKERVAGSGSSQYLIWSPDETFRCADSVWHWKWDSADQYGNFEKGKRYEIKVYGWRVGFFNMYRNIVEMREVSDD